jgi:hypothetical protein
MEDATFQKKSISEIQEIRAAKDKKIQAFIWGRLSFSLRPRYHFSSSI